MRDKSPKDSFIRLIDEILRCVSAPTFTVAGPQRAAPRSDQPLRAVPPGRAEPGGPRRPGASRPSQPLRLTAGEGGGAGPGLAQVGDAGGLAQLTSSASLPLRPLSPLAPLSSKVSRDGRGSSSAGKSGVLAGFPDARLLWFRILYSVKIQFGACC